MLTIAGSSGGQGGYYIEVATAEYYLAGGEPLGKWIGSGTREWSLSGTVKNEEFMSLLHGYAPDGRATPLVKNAGAEHRREGYDLTFSAPKSVSVVWSQADQALRSALQKTQEEAVQAAIAYLEKEACYSRSGAGGAVREKAQFVGAMFEHGTSRAQDPQLHTHVFVFNVCVCEDGQKRTLENDDLYRHKMAAGALYRAELSEGLRRLGFEIEREGFAFRIVGVPHALETEFSKRREQIEAILDSKGLSGAIASELACLSTRKVKEHVAREDLLAYWQEVGRAHGLTPFAVNALLNDVGEIDYKQAVQETVASALSRATTQNNTFTKRDFVRFFAEEGQGKGLTARTIERAADVYLKEAKDIHRLGYVQGEERFTTREIIELERDLIGYARVSKVSVEHKVSPESVEAAIASRPTINPEQADALRHITERKGSVQIVTGMAGTGKTFLMDAAREIWEAEGYTVLGAALANKAARGLAEGADMEATSIARTLYQIERGTLTLTPKTVLIVDEAGMVDTRQMKALMQKAYEGGAKLVFVGDARQLQAITNGGAFSALAHELGDAKLTTIIRQKEEWARSAVHQMADGNALDALRAYLRRDLLTIRNTPEDTMQKLVQDWKAHALANPCENLILAATRLDVWKLNQFCQETLRQEGKLGEESVTIGRENFHAGDRVVFTKGNRYMGVETSDLGIIERLDAAERLLVVRLDRGEKVRVSLDYFEALQLGYAVTTHKGQGDTVDRAYIYLSGQMVDKEMGYVQTSRAREETRLYTITNDEGESLTGMNTVYNLAKALSISHEKELALTLLRREEAAQAVVSEHSDVSEPPCVQEQRPELRQEQEQEQTFE